jgi:hypothetical protein
MIGISLHEVYYIQLNICGRICIHARYVALTIRCHLSFIHQLFTVETTTKTIRN